MPDGEDGRGFKERKSSAMAKRRDGHCMFYLALSGFCNHAMRMVERRWNGSRKGFSAFQVSTSENFDLKNMHMSQSTSSSTPLLS